MALDNNNCNQMTASIYTRCVNSALNQKTHLFSAISATNVFITVLLKGW